MVLPLIAAVLLTVLATALYSTSVLRSKTEFVQVLLSLALCAIFPSFVGAWFLLLCAIADLCLGEGTVLSITGGALYAVTYSSVAILNSVLFKLYFNWVYFVIAFVIIALVIVAYILIGLKFKMEKWMLIALPIYAVVCLGCLIYTFMVTKNIGYLALTIGDILLGVTFLFPKKRWIHCVSQGFFYLGLSFVARAFMLFVY